MDSTATIADLRDTVVAFRDARGWNKHTDPKSLAEALSIEAAELLEIFLWKDKQEIIELVRTNAAYRTALSDEIADVCAYLLQIAGDCNIDLSDAFEQKMKKNAKKYPVEQYQGRDTNKYA